MGTQISQLEHPASNRRWSRSHLRTCSYIYLTRFYRVVRSRWRSTLILLLRPPFSLHRTSFQHPPSVKREMRKTFSQLHLSACDSDVCAAQEDSFIARDLWFGPSPWFRFNYGPKLLAPYFQRILISSRWKLDYECSFRGVTAFAKVHPPA